MDTGDILIAAAVAGELEDLRADLGDAATRRIGTQRITSGQIGPQAVRLVVTGPGLANTVHGITLAVATQKPALILQTGCGGGFHEAGLQIGDVAVASAEIDIQLGVEPAGPEAVPDTLSFPVIQKPAMEIFSRYPVDAGEADRAVLSLEKALAGSGVNVFKGAFVTVATVTASAVRSGQLHRHYGALLENMEGAGSAHVAALYDIPFLEIRAVSNRVGDRAKTRWDLPLAFRRCSQAVRLYLEDRLA